MYETTLKMGMGGFFHDMGKFADKDALGVTVQYIQNNSGLYLPSYQGRYSHYHAVYTAAFIEQMKDVLPAALNSPQWGEGDAFINLAAGHHKPETPMQQIITEADRLTSGIDRDTFDEMKSQRIPVSGYKKTRLLPLFEQLLRTDMDSLDRFAYAYPLEPLSPTSIFPKEKDGMIMVDAAAEYRSLFEGFCRGLGQLRHRNENLALWFEHFESLFSRYASAIPAARVGDVVPDVSLYDHCRLTGAFSAALYLYHKDQQSLELSSIKDMVTPKFLMISGNFYGIQDFIFTGYGDTRKYRSKLLRGRSFYVTLLTELAADMLCREVGLPGLSVVLNAAGRFTVLAPNAPGTLYALETVVQRVNDWLIELCHGEVSMGFSHVAASASDFIGPAFMHLWDKIGQSVDERKYGKIDLNRYGGVAAGYLDKFDNELEQPLCPLCGKRPSEQPVYRTPESDELGAVCSLCRDHVFLGSRLVKEKGIVVGFIGAPGFKPRISLSRPVFNHYQMAFCDPVGDGAFEAGQMLKFWDISLKKEGEGKTGVTQKFVNSYVPLYTESDLNEDRFLSTGKSETKLAGLLEEIRLGELKSLQYIAAMALNPAESKESRSTGLEALGILKADIDRLGMIMACGLEPRRFTISRLATLSRQFDHFFTIYIPHLLMTQERFKNVYTVFGGGDDLFLIGPWNRIYDLTLTLADRFAEYVCRNPDVHFSAGISIQKAQVPLNTLAGSAEAALEHSKESGRGRLTLFGRTTEWKDIPDLEQIREQIEVWRGEGLLSNAMLYRMDHFIKMAALEDDVLKKTAVTTKDMECLKWRALFAYSAKRNIGTKISDKERREEVTLDLMSQLANWLHTHKGRLTIPLWNVLYNQR